MQLLENIHKKLQHDFEWEVSHLYSSQIASLYSILQREATFKITTHAIHALNVVID
jgi:hypothetical protein